MPYLRVLNPGMEHLIELSPFPGSWTHLGDSRGLRSKNQGQKYIKARPILGHILTFFDPSCQPGQIFWYKWLVQVSHIKYYMCHVELAPWGVFLPSEVRFRGILALSRA